MNLQPSGYEPDELPIAPPRDREHEDTQKIVRYKVARLRGYEGTRGTRVRGVQGYAHFERMAIKYPCTPVPLYLAPHLRVLV